ncbi:PREDICTED: coiled-coil domain-containing protein 96 isoform X2 [Odobenus rosmarus divergens]|uniref:Coiled-coil domain-containing protein 96 isoform X2 n=1 Tax=Odobenus rosmarus divergens TaxID=9708 RepID=A0A2U3VMI1_ODORO|nr:PREDICTED: coiled-coil domain-containing protein 96 isoform X2 [Odobenus rosmarus divergens]
MDRSSEHRGDPGGEDGDVANLSPKLSGIKATSGPHSPAEPPEPEPGTVEASEGGAAEDEPAEPREAPAATEAVDQAGPGEPEPPAEAETEPEPGEPADAGPEETAQPGPGGGSAEPEERAEEEGEEEEEEGEERKKAPSAVSVPLSTTGPEEAAPTREAEQEEGEEEEESEEIKARGVQGRPVKSKEKEEGERLDEGEDEWTEETQKLQEHQLRAELLEQYQSLVVERSNYQRYNMYLQHKISEALRKKKGLDAAEVPDKPMEPEAPEKEQAYLRHLALLEELRKQQADDLDWYQQELNQLKKQCKEVLSSVEKEWASFQALKKQVVMQAMGSCRMRGGRQAALREVEQIQALEDKKEKEMRALRLENVQLKQSLVHFETRTRAQEDLTEGLLLIDFEQLKIENQTFNEKVEERNEELLKLHNKMTNNVQIITHVKEKLHFVDIENVCKKTQLLEIEAQVALRRDILTRRKQVRDSLRADNIKLNQKCGLLGKELLLRDMEEKVDRTEVLNQRLESLKRHHAGLTMSCRGMKQKIREAKAFLPS